jgi:hypothetical protein
LLLTLLTLHPVPQEEPGDVDALVRAHLEARGGEEALRAIETLVYSQGTYQEGDHRGAGDAYMAFKRPFFRRIGDPERPGSFAEGYDGSTWEWYADPGVVVRTVGAASEAIRRGARFEAPFVRPEEHGTTIELGEPIELDGRPVVALDVTSRDGGRTTYYLDPESHLVVANRIRAPIHAFGEEVTTVSVWGDYREVAGVLFAHHYRTRDLATGEVLSEMRWGRIEANRELPEEWFHPPRFERTRLQRFLEQLYQLRSDVPALLWSYVDFRTAYPDVPTRAGVEFIGYQLLKMRDVDAAIALLEANVRDHPRSSSAEYELGRAHETTGDVESARYHYERALLKDAPDPRAEAALEALD